MGRQKILDFMKTSISEINILLILVC